MDPLSIGMMLAGAFLTQKANQDALQKQQRMARESQQRSLQAQNQATDVAMRQVQEFDPGTRKANQDEITQDLTQRYQTAATAAPITAQGVQVGQTIPGGTTDYLAQKGRETAKAAESNRNLAALLGRIGSAGQLRRNEGVAFGDTAGEIGRIGTGANNVSAIDQIGINSVTPSLGMTIAGQALSGYGMGKLATAGLGGAMKAGAPGGFANGRWLVGPQ